MTERDSNDRMGKGIGMWCNKCGEGVPMVATPEDPNVCVCVQCKRSYYIDPGNHGSAIPFSTRIGSAQPLTVPLAFDRPERRIESTVPGDEPYHTIGPPHFLAHGGKSKSGQKRAFSSLLWPTLVLGFALLASGSGLIGYSFASTEFDMWRVGIPLALAGQAVLFIGIALELDMLNFQSRRSARALEELAIQVAKKNSKRSRKRGKKRQSRLPTLSSRPL